MPEVQVEVHGEIGHVLWDVALAAMTSDRRVTMHTEGGTIQGVHLESLMVYADGRTVVEGHQCG